jgi:hypothetical protein
VLVWSFGMLFELSLTVTGAGIGGVHPETVPSFVLAQGYYIASALVACYTLPYSSFVALPLLFVDEELLWKEACPPQRHSIPFFWALGFGLALAIRIFWGLVYSPIVTRLFDLPPNLSGT